MVGREVTGDLTKRGLKKRQRARGKSTAGGAFNVGGRENGRGEGQDRTVSEGRGKRTRGLREKVSTTTASFGEKEMGGRSLCSACGVGETKEKRGKDACGGQRLGVAADFRPEGGVGEKKKRVGKKKRKRKGRSGSPTRSGTSSADQNGQFETCRRKKKVDGEKTRGEKRRKKSRPVSAGRRPGLPLPSLPERGKRREKGEGGKTWEKKRRGGRTWVQVATFRQTSYLIASAPPKKGGGKGSGREKGGKREIPRGPCLPAFLLLTSRLR